MKPLLSICIPTFNRASYLKQALDAYVNNTSLNEDVEIVISDNASTYQATVFNKNGTEIALSTASQIIEWLIDLKCYWYKLKQCELPEQLTLEAQAL